MAGCIREIRGQILALMTFLSVSGVAFAQTTTMPDVVGMDIAAANALVKATIAKFATLWVEPTNDPALVGKIEAQTPQAGAPLDTSTVITLTSWRANTPGLLTLVSPAKGATDVSVGDTVVLTSTHPLTYYEDYWNPGNYAFNDFYLNPYRLGSSWSEDLSVLWYDVSNDSRTAYGVIQWIAPDQVYVLRAEPYYNSWMYRTRTGSPTYFSTGVPIPGGSVEGSAVFPAAFNGWAVDPMVSEVWLRPENWSQPTKPAGEAAVQMSYDGFWASPGTGLATLGPMSGNRSAFSIKPVAAGTNQLFGRARLYSGDPRFGRFLYGMCDANQDGVADNIGVGTSPVLADVTMTTSPFGISQGDAWFLNTGVTRFRLDTGTEPANPDLADIVVTPIDDGYTYRFIMSAGRTGVVFTIVDSDYNNMTIGDRIPVQPNIPSLSEPERWVSSTEALFDGPASSYAFEGKLFAVFTPEGKYGLFLFRYPQTGDKPARDSLATSPVPRSARMQNGDGTLYAYWAYQPDGTTRFGRAQGPFEMPNLVGVTQSEATAQLTLLGFGQPNVRYVGTTIPSLIGKVKEQEPAAGQSVYPEWPVTLTVWAQQGQKVQILGVTPANGAVNVGAPAGPDSVLVTITVALSGGVELIPGDNGQQPNVEIMVAPDITGVPVNYTWNAARDTLRYAIRLPKNRVFDVLITPSHNDDLGVELANSAFFMSSFSTGPDFAGARLSGTASIPNMNMPARIALLLNRAVADFGEFGEHVIERFVPISQTGAYSFTGLAAGRYWLVGMSFDPATMDGGSGTMPEIYYGMYDLYGDRLPDPLDFKAATVRENIDFSMRRLTAQDFGQLRVVSTSPDPFTSGVPTSTTVRVVFNEEVRLEGGKPAVSVMLISPSLPVRPLSVDSAFVSADRKEVWWNVQLVAGTHYQIFVSDASAASEGKTFRIPVAVPFATSSFLPSGSLNAQMIPPQGGASSASGYAIGFLKTLPSSADPTTWNFAWLMTSTTPIATMRYLPLGSYYVAAVSLDDPSTYGVYGPAGAPVQVNVTETGTPPTIQIALKQGLGENVVSAVPAPESVNVPLQTRIEITYRSPLPTEGYNLMLWPWPVSAAADSFSADRRTVYRRVTLAANTAYQVFAAYQDGGMPVSFVFSTGSSIPSAVVAGTFAVQASQLSSEVQQTLNQMPFITYLAKKIPSAMQTDNPIPSEPVRIGFAYNGTFAFPNVPQGDYYLFAAPILSPYESPLPSVFGYLDQNNDGLPDKISVGTSSLVGLRLNATEVTGLPRLLHSNPGMFQTNFPAAVDTFITLVFSADYDTSNRFMLNVFPTPPTGQPNIFARTVTHLQNGNWQVTFPVRFAANTTYTVWINELNSTQGGQKYPRAWVFTTGSSIPNGQVSGRLVPSALSRAGDGFMIAMLSESPVFPIDPAQPLFTGLSRVALVDGQGNFRVRYLKTGTYYPFGAIIRSVNEANGTPSFFDAGQVDANGDGRADGFSVVEGADPVSVTIPMSWRSGNPGVTIAAPQNGALSVSTTTTLRVSFAKSVLNGQGGIRIAAGQVMITPKPVSAGSFQLGADNFTITQQLTLKPNTTYQVTVWDGPLPASALFTTGSSFPAGSISGQISIATSSPVAAVDHAYVVLLTSPPVTTNLDSLPAFRIVSTVDGKYSFKNLPDSTYYVFAGGYYGGGEGYDQQISTTLVPAPLRIAGGNAITGANYALGGSATASPPRVVSFNVAVVQVRQPAAVFLPTVSARVADANGDNTIATVFVRKPDGGVVTVPRVSDGVYEGVLDPLYTFAGGTYRLWAVDNTGLESAVLTDSISAPSLGEPGIISPVPNASNVSLTPLLDWSDVVGAAGYVVNLSTENPISFSDPAGAVARFLDPANTVVNFRDAPVTLSELRIPSGRLKPSTTYYWAVGAIDKAVDHDHVSLSVFPSFTTGAGTAVVDTLPPVFTKTPEVASVDSSSIALAWVTDEASDTRVRFGRSAGVYTDSLSEPTMTKVHTIVVTGLAPATEYFLEVSSRDHAGNVARAPLPRSVLTKDRADRTAPNFIAGPTTERVDVNSVTIYWENDEPTTAVVNLVGTGKDTTVYDTRLVRGHRLEIRGLLPTTAYAYSVSVIDAARNGPSIRPGQAFVTKSLPDTNPPRALRGPVVTANERDAFIAWDADELHTARVEITLAGAQGAMFSETFVDIPAIVQLARLTGLAPGTEYRAIVELTDLARNTAKTRPITFWTKAAPDTVPPRIIRFPSVVYRADTRAIVEWETDEMADSYLELYQGARLVNTFNRGDLVRVHRFLLTNLQAGASYSFRVINADAARNQVVWPLAPPSAKPAKEAGGRTGSEFTTTLVPDQTAPQVVSGPTVLSSTATTVTVAWNTDENANSVVRFGEGSAGRVAREGATVEFTDAVTITENVTSHQVTLTGLKPGTAYTYQIGSTDPSGNGETTSNPQTVYTLHEEDLAAPLILGGPAVIGRTDSRITVKWTTDEPSDSKVVFRRAGTSEPPTEVVVPDNVIEHVVTLTNLLPSQSYEIAVQSSDLVGNGPSSASVTGSTQAAADTKAPSFTGGPTVSADATQALISWTTDEPSDTRVEYGTTVALGLVANLATFSTNHLVTLTNLTPATQYYYRISSGDASGNIADSTSGSLVWTTLASADVTPPEKVTGVTSLNGAYSVRLSWAANTDADLDVYVIERAIGAGGFAKIAEQKITSFTDQTVVTGTTYRYRLRAQDRSANRNLSVPSDTITVTPLLSHAPGAPSAFPQDATVSGRPVLKVTNGTANLRPVAGHLFIVARDSALTQIVTTNTVAVSGSTTEWQLPFMLDHLTKYWWAARAVDNAGFMSPFSERTSFTVDTLAKKTAVQLAAFSATGAQSHITVAWRLAAASPEASFTLWRAAGENGEYERVSGQVFTGGREFVFFDRAVVPGVEYRYRVEAAETASGRATFFGPLVARVAAPEKVVLDQNTPNPFNPVTQIAYQVPWAADVKLVIFNSLGQEIRTLVNGPQSAGFYRVTWDGRTTAGGDAASGVYFARLVVTPREAGSRTAETRVIRMLLIK